MNDTELETRRIRLWVLKHSEILRNAFHIVGTICGFETIECLSRNMLATIIAEYYSGPSSVDISPIAPFTYEVCSLTE